MLIVLTRTVLLYVWVPLRKRCLLATLLSVAAFLYGCIEVEQHLWVHDDGSASLKGTIKIDPQYEAVLLPQLQKDMPGQLPAGVRIDFSRRIDGKATIVIEAEGAAAAEMLKRDGSTTIIVSDAGFMKKRYAYRQIVSRTPETPFPHRGVMTLPGSIESVEGVARPIAIVVRTISNDPSGEAERASWPR